MTTMNWQPIETAPKDGTNILVWDGYNQYVAFWGESSLWARKSDDWCYGQCSGEHNSYSTVDEPTLWQPCPADPE